MINELTYGNSQMMFNERVLNAGHVDGNLEKISNQLMFNKIYLDNTDEIFRRECSEDMIKIHHKCIKEIEININAAIAAINDADKMDISNQLDFENRLIVADLINDEFSGAEVNSLAEYNFKEGQIYYLYKRQEQWIILTASNRSVIYQKPFMYAYKDFGRCWQTLPSIIRWINNAYIGDNGITVTALKVVTYKNEPGISKIEYAAFDKDQELLSAIQRDLQPGVVMFNSMLYIDDIISIAEMYYPYKLHTEDEVKSLPIPLHSYELDDVFNQDILSKYPRESFDMYLRLLNKAAMDKRVSEINLCIYRIGNNPSIFYTLREAIRNGKIVKVNVEMKASGEAINEFWMKELRRIGAHVTSYQRGFLKVHAKLTLIKFRDGKMITQIGTGNYHWKTTTRYSDLSYITSNHDIGIVVDRLFRYMSNEYEDIKTMNIGDDFIITPINGRKKLLELINSEGDKKNNGCIAIKCNTLEDSEVIDALNDAASKGCKVYLNIRGVCLWNPGEMLNKNVTIVSIVWDQLEHSRVFCFGSQSNIKVYMGSLDLVKRKIDRRIETLVRIPDYSIALNLASYVFDCVLNHPNRYLMMNDNGIYYKPIKEVKNKDDNV